MNATIGIIGVGHLAGYLVTGLMRSETPPTIVLSPRGADSARKLSERYGLPIATSNADVVERSDIVLLATRPGDLIDAISDLPWRDDQIALSVAAGVALSGLQRAVAPAAAVRSLPVTSAEIGESPTCIYPDNSQARALFEQLGSVHSFDDEGMFDLASMQGVIYSAFHAGIASLATWYEDAGLAPEAARELSAQSVRATASMVLAHPEQAVQDMVTQYATPGSLTLTTLEALRKNGGLTAWPEALDAALTRCREINRTTR